MVKEVETPSGIRFDDTTNAKSAIGAEASHGEHSSNHGNGQQPVSAKSKKCSYETKEKQEASQNPSTHGRSRTVDPAKERHPHAPGMEL
jgi:hypothetical protein